MTATTRRMRDLTIEDHTISVPLVWGMVRRVHHFGVSQYTCRIVESCVHHWWAERDRTHCRGRLCRHLREDAHRERGLLASIPQQRDAMRLLGGLAGAGQIVLQDGEVLSVSRLRSLGMLLGCRCCSIWPTVASSGTPCDDGFDEMEPMLPTQRPARPARHGCRRRPPRGGRANPHSQHRQCFSVCHR